MSKALVVGIEKYLNIRQLYGCGSDAESVEGLLFRNDDGTLNFRTQLRLGTDAKGLVTQDALRADLEELFIGKEEAAVFYFSGHGFADNAGGYLCTSDTRTGRDGIPLAEIMTLANRSEHLHRIIILDSCYSGAAAEHPLLPGLAEVSEGVTVLTASTAQQYSLESNGTGLFTSYLIDALKGAAANVLGHVTPGSVYAHIDESLGSWGQRPTLKANVRRFMSLRKARPPIAPPDLHRIIEFFPVPEAEYPLSPEFESHRFPGSDLPTPDPKKTAIFKILQNYNRLNLLVPVGAEHMYNAAMESKSCRLTLLGEHYRDLVARRLI